MHQSFERPLTAEERQRLLDLMPVPPRPPFPVIRLIRRVFEMACVMLAGCVLVAVKDVSAIIVFPCIAVIYLLYYEFELADLLFLRRQRYALEYNPVMKFRKAVEAAQTVRVHSFEVNALVQMHHDDGTIYLLDLGDGQTYWLDAGYSQMGRVPDRLPPEWPSTKFELFQLPNYAKQIGPFCTGTKLRPRESVEMNDLVLEGVDFDNVVSADGFINKPLDTFLEELKALSREAAALKK